MLDLMSRNWQK